MKASSLCFLGAVVLLLAGMLWGIIMGISDDHAAMPAHAHLNLLGWVSLFLFGIFYHLHPSTDIGRTAMIQVGIWIVGTIILTIGVGLVHTGHVIGDPIAAIGSIIVFADAVLFGWLVYRSQFTPARLTRSSIPAE